MNEFCKSVVEAIQRLGLTTGFPRWNVASEGADLCVLRSDDVAVRVYLDVRDQAVTSALRFLNVPAELQEDMETHIICRFFDLNWDNGRSKSCLDERISVELRQVMILLEKIGVMNTPLQTVFDFYQGYTQAYNDYMSGQW